jgi:DNA-directed RNA polymerase specialized sigma24 family protein
VTLLGRTWALWDVEDVEALCRGVLASTKAATLPPCEFEDALADLITEAWILSEQFDPARTSSFSTYAFRLLKLRAADGARRKYRTRWVFKDRVYERERPAVFSLDAETGMGGQDPRHGRPGHTDRVTGELARAYAERSSDPQADCDPDLERILTGGDRQIARDLDELGIAPNGRVAA